MIVGCRAVAPGGPLPASAADAVDALRPLSRDEHLFDGFVSVDGITLPTRHRIHPRDAADRADISDVIVAIDIDDFAFGQP
jgi:hypothetical protein